MKELYSLLRNYKALGKNKQKEICGQLESMLSGANYTNCYVTYYGKHLRLKEFAALFSLEPYYVYACYEYFGGDVDKYIYHSGRPYVEFLERTYDKHEFGVRHNIPWHLVSPLENQNYGLYLDMITKFVRAFPSKFGTIGDLSVDPFSEDYTHQRMTVTFNAKLRTRSECFSKFLVDITPEVKPRMQRIVEDYEKPLSAAQV